MSTFDLTHAQFLWLMVASQLAIFAGMWLMAAAAMKSYAAGMRMIGVFNLLLGVSVLLVAFRGTSVPDVLTRTVANLTGLAGFVAIWAGVNHLFKLGHSTKEPWLVLLISGVAIITFSLMPGYGNHRVAAQFIAVAWIILRTAAFATPLIRARFGWLPTHLTNLIVWLFVAVILLRSFGAVFLGWQIEIDRDRPGNLGFAYFVMACITSINSLLAYIYMRSVMAEVESLARQDPLTGLPNRRALQQQQALYWNRWTRQQSKFAVICLDIDHFKSINDQFGHDVGDEVLTRVGQTLQQQVRPMDTLARTGGEEFVVLLDLHQSGDDLLQIAERLRQAVQGLRLWPETPERNITVSLGVALPTPQDDQPASVVSRADRALYLAKANGRNRVEVAQELQSSQTPPQALTPGCVIPASLGADLGQPQASQTTAH